MNTYKVIKAFSVPLDDNYDWANNSVTDFKVGDYVKADDTNGTYFINYAYQEQTESATWKTMAIPIDRANLKFVSVCSGYSGYDDECVSPNATVIDNTANPQKGVTGAMTKFFKAPFGLSPLLGYSVLIGGSALVVWGVVMIVKIVKK